MKAGARILPYSVIGRQTHVDEGARRSTARSSGRTAGSAARRSSARRSSAATATSAATPSIDTPVVLGDKTVITDYSRLMSRLHDINPTSSRPTTSAGSIPRKSNEDAARQIGRGFVAYLEAKRIAVSRDMRLSSPSVAAAFIEGARAQGADVVDYGMMGDRHDVLRRRARRPRRRRADHRVAQPEAVQRHQDGAARGVSAQRRRRASATSAT